MSLKNSNDRIGNRTRDLPVCSAMPQPSAPPCAPILWNVSAQNWAQYFLLDPMSFCSCTVPSISTRCFNHTKLPTWCTEYYLFVKYYYSPLHVSSIKYSSSGGHSCTQVAYGTVTLYKSPSVLLICSYRENSYPVAAYQQDTRTLIESDGTICCLCTTMSSWRWVLDTRNM